MRAARMNLLLCAIATMAALGVMLGVASPIPAEAAGPSDGFDASNIIDDELFYDGNAMTASEVQTFLNQRLPQCWLGRPGYEIGKAVTWGGVRTTLASKCTKDLVSPTQSRASNAYCSAYIGGGNETAAQIIQKVGKACGISQRVLLITLEKEQSLISDPWPNNEQYFRAMGYACPDSGPGGTANCDPKLGGFFQQVYRAAWQLKVYRAFPNSYSYKPFQNNYIQWHPNASCGGSTVNIQNWATAALYIYTPYRPNQAALNAGWGTGDACSSYGNRNFYNFYTSWFGSTRGFRVSGDIATYWRANGESSGVYGGPTGHSTYYTTRYPAGVWLQYFSGGIISTELNTGKTVGIPFGRVFNFYNSEAGGIRGELGAPVSEATAYAPNGGATLQFFQGGLVIVAKREDTVSSVNYGPVYDLYNNSAGGIYGELGYPLGALKSYRGGKLQQFQGGIITQVSGAASPVFVAGSFYSHYNSKSGGIYGRLGFPVGSERTLGDGSFVQDFERGYLYRKVSGAVVEVSGEAWIAETVATTQGTPLGKPTGASVVLVADGGATLTQFERGVIVTEHRTSKTSSVSGGIYTYYNSQAAGGVYGGYGYPVANPIVYSANGGGTLQVFRNGILFYGAGADTATGMRTNGAIFQRYNSNEGGIYGWLGWPIGDEVVGAGGVRTQSFQNGRITVDARGVTQALPYATSDNYRENATSLGAPAGGTRKYEVAGGAWLSFFDKGIIVESQKDGTAGAMLYSSSLYQHYNGKAGGIYGSLGLPTADETTDSSGAKIQAFQEGTLRSYKGGPVRDFSQLALNRYLAAGAEASVLGAPTGDQKAYTANGGGTLQFFARGLITTESNTNTTVMLPEGPIYTYYNQVAGGIYGTLGYPTSEQTSVSGVTTQKFQNGTLTYANGTVTRS